MFPRLKKTVLAAAILAALLCAQSGALAAPALKVVIDPGHGGGDMGAIGPSGVAEKDVVLAIALRLADEIRERHGAEVVLTRRDDTFVPLKERTALANATGADLFVSIHANAAYERAAKGIETYFLSVEATDEEAERVARFENSASSNDEADEGGADLELILTDLASNQAHHDSARLAELIHSSLANTVKKDRRGIKQAPFAVLSGAAMPAVLVEVGFISNPLEEKRLKSRKDQAAIAGHIADGIGNFINGSGRSYVGIESATKN